MTSAATSDVSVGFSTSSSLSAGLSVSLSDVYDHHANSGTVKIS